jgi:hypothetical protein
MAEKGLEEAPGESLQPNSPFMRFVFFPVGHGSCTLVSLPPEDPGGQRIYGVIDCRHAYARPVEEYIRSPWFPGETPVNTPRIALKFVILTHYHRDHYLGIDRLLGEDGRFSCELFLHPFPPPGVIARRRDISPDDRDRLNRIEANAHNRAPLHSNTTYDWVYKPKGAGFRDSRLSIRGLAPSCNTLDQMDFFEKMADAAHANDLSSALRFQFGRCAVVFGGDVEEREWSEIIIELKGRGELGLLAANLCLSPHHGGRGNSFELWERISRCSPWHKRNLPSNRNDRRRSRTLAIISCGGRDPNSPSESMIRTLLQTCSTVCCIEPGRCCIDHCGYPDASWPCRQPASREGPSFEEFARTRRLPKTARPHRDYRAGSICVDIYDSKKPQWYRHDGNRVNRQPGAFQDPACNWVLGRGACGFGGHG